MIKSNPTSQPRVAMSSALSKSTHSAHRRFLLLVLLLLGSQLLLVQQVEVFTLPLADHILTVREELLVGLPRVLGAWIPKPLHKQFKSPIATS